LLTLIAEFFGSRLLLKKSNAEINRTVITAVVLYECMGADLGISRMKRVVENRVQSGIFGTKREEIRGGWRKFDFGEFHNFLSSQNIGIHSRKIRRW
jgi:hypothetical protein